MRPLSKPHYLLFLYRDDVCLQNLCIYICLAKKWHTVSFLQTNNFADINSFGNISAGGSDTVFTLMPPDLIVSWWATMHGKMKFFHITKNVVSDPWVINCAGVGTDCHHFPWLNPAACSALQLARHSQLHKSVLCYTPMAPTCRAVSNVIVIVPGHLSDFQEIYFELPRQAFSWTP